MIKLLNIIGTPSIKMNSKKREWMLTFFFMLLSICTFVYTIFPIYVHLFYKCLIGMLVMSGIIIFSIDRELKSVKNNFWITFLWILFGSMRLITGIVTSVEYLPLACIWLVGFGTLFFIWNNRKDYEKLFECCYRGFLYPTIIFFAASVILVPITEKAYTGLTNNANMIGMYIAAILGIVVWKILYSDDKKVQRKNIVLLSFLISFIFYSRSRTITVVCIGTVLTAVLYKIIFQKEIKKALFSLAIIVVGSVISCVLLLEINQCTTSIVSFEFGESEDADLEAVFEGYSERMSGKDKTASGIDNYSSGRVGIWMKAISKFNMKGHPSREHIVTMRNGDVGNNAHNVFIQFAYDHGIVGGIVFILLSVSALVNIFKYCIKSNDSLFILMLLIQVSYIGIGLFASINMPFLYLISFVYYMTFAILFDKDLETIKVKGEV